MPRQDVAFSSCVNFCQVTETSFDKFELDHFFAAFVSPNAGLTLSSHRSSDQRQPRPLRKHWTRSSISFNAFCFRRGTDIALRLSLLFCQPRSTSLSSSTLLLYDDEPDSTRAALLIDASSIWTRSTTSFNAHHFRDTSTDTALHHRHDRSQRYCLPRSTSLPTTSIQPSNFTSHVTLADFHWRWRQPHRSTSTTSAPDIAFDIDMRFRHSTNAASKFWRSSCYHMVILAAAFRYINRAFYISIYLLTAAAFRFINSASVLDL